MRILWRVLQGRTLPDDGSSLSHGKHQKHDQDTANSSAFSVRLVRCGFDRGLIRHNRGSMTSMAGLSTARRPGWRTTPFTRADFCSILQVSFPGPLRGESPSSTESLAVIARKSGSDQ